MIQRDSTARVSSGEVRQQKGSITMTEKMTDEIREKLAPGFADLPLTGIVNLELKTPGELLDEIMKLRKQHEWLSKALFEIATDKTGNSEYLATKAMLALGALSIPTDHDRSTDSGEVR